MSNHSGGPAFPVQIHNRTGEDILIGEHVCPDGMFTQFTGVSVRDYFAAKALVGLLSDTANVSSPELFAKVSYQHADAMLAERAK